MSKFANAFAILDDSDDESPKAVAPAPKKEVQAKENNKERRRPNNNDRNTRGGRGPRNARDGKRTYDRRSGTGRGKEIKKGGGGGRNWGSDKQEARKNEGPVDENAPVEEPVADAEPVEEPVVEEEEDNTMTMEEYLASKAGKSAGDSLFGAKKEKTVDDSDFSGKAAHEIVMEDFLVMGDGKKVRQRAPRKEAQKLDSGFRVSASSDYKPRRDNEGGRGGRGGRGDRRRNDKRGGRSGRGGKRTGGRGGGLKVDDLSAFPSL